MQWLDDKLSEKGWTRAELARQAHISQSILSHLDNSRRNPGVEVCRAISKALRIPLATVYREAGLLPKEKDNDPDFEELKYWFNQMNADERAEFLETGRWRVERRQSRGKGTLSDEHGVADT